METRKPIIRRTQRASLAQMNALVDHMLQNKEFAANRPCSGDDRLLIEKKWKALSIRLNAMGRPSKSAKQWATVWRDLRHRTSIKAATLRNEQLASGNNPADFVPLTQVEMKVLDVMGIEYDQGNQTSDSIPKEEMAQVNMDDQFVTVKVENVSEQPPVTTDYVGPSPILLGIPNGISVGTFPATVPTFVKVDPLAAIGGATQQSRRNTARRTTEQQHNCRDFIQIQKEFAASMKMMAKAMTRLAEANTVQAEVARQQADNDSRRVDVMQLLAENQRKIINLLSNK